MTAATSSRRLTGDLLADVNRWCLDALAVPRRSRPPVDAQGHHPECPAGYEADEPCECAA